MRKFLTVVAVPVAVSAAFAAPAVAARPAQATLTVSTADASASSQPTVGSSLVFSGCGYQAGMDVGVTVTGPTATTYIGDVVGSDGCFTTEGIDFAPQNSGSYTAAAYQSSKRKADATVTFTVS